MQSLPADVQPPTQDGADKEHSEAPIPPDATARQSSQRRRRRPRKLNRTTSDIEPIEKTTPLLQAPKFEGEISRLKTRVGEVEAQVRAIRDSSSGPDRKGVRRRTRERKNGSDDQQSNEKTSGPSIPHASSAKVAQEETLNTEEHVTDDEVEEIPRAPDLRPELEKRAVTVVGSYRLPLPAGVSEKELQAVQRGLSSVSSIARRVMAENKPEATVTEFQRTQSGSGWSSWFGSYSASIARVVNNIDLQASVDANVQVAKQPCDDWAQPRTQPMAKKKKPRKLKTSSDVAEEGEMISEQEQSENLPS